MLFLHCQHVEFNTMNLPSTWKYSTMLPFSRPNSCLYAQLLTYFFPVCWFPFLCVLFKCWCCLGCSHAMQSPWLISFITLTTTSILTTNKSVSLAHSSFPSSVPMFLTAYYLRYTIWSLSRYLTLIMSQINLLYSPLYELSSPTEFPGYCSPSSFTPSPIPETWVLFQLPLSSWLRLLYIGFSCSIIWIRTATLFWDMTSPPSTSGLDSPSFTV